MSANLTTPLLEINRVHGGGRFNRLFSSIFAGVLRVFAGLPGVCLKWRCRDLRGQFRPGRRISEIAAHLQDDQIFELPFDDLVGYGFEASLEAE